MFLLLFIPDTQAYSCKITNQAHWLPLSSVSGPVFGYMANCGLLFYNVIERQYQIHTQYSPSSFFRSVAASMYARSSTQKQLVSTGSSLVYMDIALDPSLRPRRVVLQLFNKNCPTTSENFRALCTGEKGKSEAGDK